MLPGGYYVISQKKDHIIVGMDFAHFNKECVPSFEINGTVYNWGPIECIPESMASSFCCCRRYNTEIKVIEMPEIERYINTDQLRDVVKEYMESLRDGKHKDDDEHFIFEAALETFYGRKVWDWVNSKL